MTLWFLNQRTNLAEDMTTAASNTPSVSFDNIEMTINSSEGVPQYKLSALKYWLYQKYSELESPDIIIYRNDGSKIFAKALKGQTHDNNNVITLIDEVRINQPKSKNNPFLLRIMTDRLTVFPEKQRALTDAPVTAIRGSQKVTALGMTLDLNTDVLQLHSKVKSHYDP